MSEKQPSLGPEIQVGSHSLEKESRNNLERLQKEAHKAESEPQNVEKLHQKVEQHAISGKEVTVGEREVPKQQSAFGTQKELKADAYKRTLQRVRKDLSGPERKFSNVVHQPLIETMSNVAGKTVARPSGILGGGMVSLLGSGFLLYTAKQYGFRYNFLVFFLLFAGGFMLGLIAEMILRLFRRRKA